ncbi:type IV secretion system protein [Magnetospirillum sp. UT-4]|uniref:type IV secretion system protein n=1 Tax=Magnetospirillum sp. UT-4 TaxID=2681467 RepID=UPI0013856319|nr:type IV secretion system protein [Magnetospirillum sp. UT-4]CAA7619328.1 conserved exported hypothetical protein [Magnetospirillum sp. UT-4]
MARPRLTRMVLAVVGLVVAVPAAQATYAVLDSAAVAKAVEQIKELKNQAATQLQQLQELKQQVAFLNDISGFMKEVQDAVGLVANMSLPIPNLERIAAQTKSDMRCLMPDGLKWGIKTEDLNLGSICEASSAYRSALFVDPAATKGMSYADQERLRVQAAGRRTALIEDTTSRALAQADVQMKQADELNSAADQLQSDLAAAKTLQDREHVQAQVQVAGLRASARQLQLLAQMLKLQAAVAIKAGLPADRVKEITGEGEGK